MEPLTLYSRDSRSKLREWTIQVKHSPSDDIHHHAIIECLYGQTGGKLITSSRVIREGKNIGKSNETTPLEQAISEAKSMITKKRQEGYAEHRNERVEHADADADADAKPEPVEPVVVSLDYRPMLAHDWSKQKRLPEYPLITQPKLDGIRMVAYLGESPSTIHMVSRNGKPIYCMNHIEAKIRELYSRGIIPEDLVLDGELYSEDLTFEEITSLTRKSVHSRYVKGGETSEDFKQIQYYIFDCFQKGHTEEPFQRRYSRLTAIESLESSESSGSPLRIVPCSLVENSEQDSRNHEDYVSRGFEGTIYRVSNAGYQVNTRSKSLLKRKDFITEEFPIIGAEEGVGRDAGAVIWKCKNESGTEFLVRPRGSLASRRDYFRDSLRYIGKNLTIRYQNLTDYGVPRFPVGLAIRDYE